MTLEAVYNHPGSGNGCAECWGKGYVVLWSNWIDENGVQQGVPYIALPCKECQKK